MKTKRLGTGIGTGGLHEFRWEQFAEPEGFRVSVVGLTEFGIVCNSVSLRDGQNRGLILGEASSFMPVDSTFLAGLGRIACGSKGFGESAFVVDQSGDFLEIPSLDGFEEIDLDQIGLDSRVGGSANVRGVEIGVVHLDGKWTVHPEVSRITGFGLNGEVFGIDHSGCAVELSSGRVCPVRGQGVGLLEDSRVVIQSGFELKIWDGEGAVADLGVRGYVRSSVLGLAQGHLLLGFGVREDGAIEHWLFDLTAGLTVLTGLELENGDYLAEIVAIGEAGDLAGISVGKSGRSIVRLF